MNRKLFHHFLQPGRLYAPQSRKSSSENVLCAESISITRVITGQTQKFLSSAVVFMHRTTSGAGTRGVGRIKLNKQNTVLLGFVFDPGEYPAICPRCHSFTKRFASLLLLSTSHIVKSLDANNLDASKRQLIDSSIDKILALSKCPGSALTAGLAASDLTSTFLNSLP